MNRREFMMLAAASAAVPAVSAVSGAGREEVKTAGSPAPERNRRPEEGSADQDDFARTLHQAEIP